MDLIPIFKGTKGPLDYRFEMEKRTSLPGAHGDEIVRDLFTDVHVSVLPASILYHVFFLSLSHSLHLTPCTFSNPYQIRLTQPTHAEKTAGSAPGREVTTLRKWMWTRVRQQQHRRRRGGKRRRKRRRQGLSLTEVGLIRGGRRSEGPCLSYCVCKLDRTRTRRKSDLCQRV